jgi:hypothetical protein
MPQFALAFVFAVTSIWLSVLAFPLAAENPTDEQVLRALFGGSWA